MSGAGHLPGNQENIPLLPVDQEHSCDWGCPAPCHPAGPFAQAYPTLLPHLASCQLPAQEPSSSRVSPVPLSSLGCHSLPRGATPACACPALPALRVRLCRSSAHMGVPGPHVCAQLTASPALSQSSLAASGTRCRRVGLFCFVCFGFRKKKIPK